MTHLGGVVFGIGIGIIVCVIRIWGSFPEGMSFAIVIMNALGPLIDKMCYKRPFGWHPSSVNILQPTSPSMRPPYPIGLDTSATTPTGLPSWNAR